LAGIYIYTCARAYIYTHEGKAIPLQAWTGHESSRRLMLPGF